jgi:hypothetical protein
MALLLAWPPLALFAKGHAATAARFSPAIASIMLAPILVAVCACLIVLIQAGPELVTRFPLLVLLGLGFNIVLFGPIFLLLLPLFALYLVAAIRARKFASRSILGGAALLCIWLQYIWLGYVADVID